MAGAGARRLTCRVHPRAAHDRVEWEGEVLSVHVHAPAVEGRANAAVIRLVARHLGVPPSRLRLVAGLRSRTKVVEVDGWAGSEGRPSAG